MDNKEIEASVALINKAYEKLALFPYVLSYSTQQAECTIVALKATQNVKGIALYTPKGNMTDSSSHSLFLSTKDRFYDNGKLVTAYQAVGKEDLKNAQQVIYDYQAFIHTFGKLPKKFYSVSNTFFARESILHDTYVAEAKPKTDSEHLIYGFLPYEIRTDTLLDARIEKDKNETRLDLTLDPRIALDYYLVQMVSTGELYDFPKFQSSKLVFHLDDKGYLLSVDAIDRYTAKTGFISANILMSSQYRFLTSETGEFSFNGKKILADIPSEKEELDLYNLFL